MGLGPCILQTGWNKKLNGAKKIMLLVRYIPAKNPKAMTESPGSLCPLQHSKPDVWRMEAGQTCLRLKVLKPS